jgi:hypothetical protein
MKVDTLRALALNTMLDALFGGFWETNWKLNLDDCHST